jgi:hypothetical protein
MDKCEKEERFEEAGIARDRILKLKNIENKRCIEDLKLKQQQELEIINFRYQEETQKFSDKYNDDLKFHNEKFEEQHIQLDEKHQMEESVCNKNFEDKYPNQPKFSPEVLNLQKIMEGHIKNQKYELANEIKIKILNLCEEQDKLHKSQKKDKKLHHELEKLQSTQKNELLNLNLKQKLIKEEFEKKFMKIEEQLKLKYKNRFREVELTHIGQINEQKKINKKNLNTKITTNRIFVRTGVNSSDVQESQPGNFILLNDLFISLKF